MLVPKASVFGFAAKQKSAKNLAAAVLNEATKKFQRFIVNSSFVF